MTLLSPESPLVASPAIAKRLGIEKALILEQLNYWLEHLTGKIVDGVKWIYASVAKHWTERIPLEPWKIRHLLEELVEEGYLKRGQWSKHSFYQAYFYTINRNKIDELIKGADVKKSRKSKNAETLKNQYLNRSTENPQIDLTTVLKSEQRSLLHKNSSPEDPPLPPQGGEGDNPNENSKTEESSANNSTPNQQTESMQQPENQSFDNFSAHSPEKENKADKFFSSRSRFEYQKKRAAEAVDFPEMLGLTDRAELEKFENDYLDWVKAHPEAGITRPAGCLRSSIRSVALEGGVFPHLNHWKQHRTLKNFLEVVPQEWEEGYSDEFGWHRIRVRKEFKNWLYDAALDAQNGIKSPIAASETVANQLRFYDKTKILWEAYCLWLPNRAEEYQKQVAMGMSGAGAIPMCMKDRSLPTLEQVNAIESKFAQASQQFTLPQAKNFVQNVLDETQKQPQLPETAMQQEEFTPEQCRENLKRLNQLWAETKKKSPDCAERSAGGNRSTAPKSLPASKPSLNLEQLQNLWATGSTAARNQVAEFVMRSDDFEFEYDPQGQIVGVREIDF